MGYVRDPGTGVYAETECGGMVPTVSDCGIMENAGPCNCVL